MAVEIRVLGRVDALVDGRALPLRGSKQRAVLAMLALRAACRQRRGGAALGFARIASVGRLRPVLVLCEHLGEQVSDARFAARSIPRANAQSGFAPLAVRSA